MTSPIRPVSISESLATRDNNLNALRLMAAILVLFSHCYPLSGNMHLEPLARSLKVFDGGAMAVIAFFFLSGYLISASWANTNHFPSFMLKRLLRILPGLAVVATICALLLGPMMSSLELHQYFQTSQAFRYIRDNINVLDLGTNTLPGVFETLPLPSAVNGSLWTLKTEFLVYIATGLLGASLLLPSEGKGAWSIIFSVIALLGAYRLACLTMDEWRALHLPLDFLSYRLIAAYLLGMVAFVNRDRLVRSWFVFAGLAAIAWMARNTSLLYFFIYLTYGYFLLLIATSPVRLLGTGVRTHDYSYGTYIYAFPIQQALVSLLPGVAPLTLFLLALPLVLACAAVSWHLVERPSLRLKAFSAGWKFSLNVKS